MLNFSAVVEIDGKPEPKKWKDSEGKERLSYKLNISQNDGRDVATIGCSEDIYNSVRRRDVLTAYFMYSDGSGTSNNKPYLKLDSISFTVTDQKAADSKSADQKPTDQKTADFKPASSGFGK